MSFYLQDIKLLRLLSFLISVLLALPAISNEVGRLGDLSVHIVAEHGTRKLIVGGFKVLEYDNIEIEEITEVDGHPVLIGYAGVRGNICGSSHFVVTLDDGEPILSDIEPRFKSYTESCEVTHRGPPGPTISFITRPYPGHDGLSWVLSIDGGLEEGPVTPFVPDTSYSWENLAQRNPTHPIEVMKSAEIYAQALRLLENNLVDRGLLDAVGQNDMLLEENKQHYFQRLSNIGSGGMLGEDFFGSACLQASCEKDRAMVYLDTSEEKAFLAWSVLGRHPPYMSPPEPEWSSDAHKAYSKWLQN